MPGAARWIRERGFAGHPVVTEPLVSGTEGTPQARDSTHGPCTASCQYREKPEEKNVLNAWKWAEHPLQGRAFLLHPVMSLLLPCSPKPWASPALAAAGDISLSHGARQPPQYPRSFYLSFCAATKATISPTHPWRPKTQLGFQGNAQVVF